MEQATAMSSVLTYHGCSIHSSHTRSTFSFSKSRGTTAPAVSAKFPSPPLPLASSSAHRVSCRASSEAATSAELAAAAAAEPAAAAPPKPAVIELEFLSPSADGEPREAFEIASGTKNLRRAMLDAKVGIYDAFGSLMNCGGGGSCGTCLVDVVEGGELLSGRTEAEGKYLKKRPDSWRLSCQAIVGDKSNGGKLVVQRLPQKKKK